MTCGITTFSFDTFGDTIFPTFSFSLAVTLYSLHFLFHLRRCYISYFLSSLAAILRRYYISYIFFLHLGDTIFPTFSSSLAAILYFLHFLSSLAAILYFLHFLSSLAAILYFLFSFFTCGDTILFSFAEK